MNKKRLVAVLASAAVISTLVIPFTACNKNKNQSLGTTTLNVADYAEDFTQSLSSSTVKSKPAYTKTTQLLSYKQSDVVASDNGSIIVLQVKQNDNSYKYSVYNILLEKYIVTDNATQPQIINSGIISLVKLTFTVNNADTNITTTEYKYLLPDGTTLLDSAVYSSAPQQSSFERYVGNDREKSRIIKFTVSAVTNGKSQNVVKYVQINQDDSGAVSYKIVNESDLKVVAPDYVKGTELKPLTDYIYADYAGDEYSVTGEISGYKYSQVGNTYTFYNASGTKTGEVKVQTSGTAGFVGNYFYYTTGGAMISSGVSADNIDEMFSYPLYQYDIVNNVTKEFHYDVQITGIMPLYNHTAKAFDAVVISGIKMTGGKKTAIGVDMFSYVTDADLKVAYDVSEFALNSNFDGIYKISDGEYLLGDKIVDENLTVKSNADFSNRVYVDEKLVLFQSGNNSYGFKDYTGKVVIEPKYSPLSGSYSIEFFGGVACVNEAQADGTTKKVLLHSDGTVTQLPKGNNVNVATYNGVYLVTTTTSGATNYEVFSFAGVSLKKSTAQLQITSMDNTLYIAEYVSASSTYNIFKIS